MPQGEETTGCEHRLLTRSAVGGVTVCRGCGQVHLELQYLTLRFEEGAFRELARMVHLAQQRLLQGRTASTPATDEAPKELH